MITCRLSYQDQGNGFRQTEHDHRFKIKTSMVSKRMDSNASLVALVRFVGMPTDIIKISPYRLMITLLIIQAYQLFIKVDSIIRVHFWKEKMVYLYLKECIKLIRKYLFLTIKNYS